MAQALLKEDILENVKETIRKHNCTMYKTYKKHGKHSEATITKYFGNWNNLLNEIGVKIKHKRNISKEDILKDVVTIFEETNNTTRENYLKYGNYSRAPINRLFGNWNNMLKELNLRTNMNKNVTKEDVINDIMRLQKEHGYVNSIIQRKHGKYSQSVIDRLFGSFTNLQLELGFSIDNRFITNDQIKQNILDIYNKFNIISVDIIDRECIVSRQTIVNRFGSVVKLLNELNINSENYNKMSKLQSYMLSLCKSILGEDYELEKSFDWLRNSKTNRKLFIDIYYPKYNLAIEVDGEQHYIRGKSVWKDSLETIQERDNCKNKLLEQNNINLIRLKYNDRKKEIIKKLQDYKNNF